MTLTSKTTGIVRQNEKIGGGSTASQSHHEFEVEHMKEQKGFTLVELLVVITIIGILVAIAIPNMNRLKIKAKETQVVAGAHQIQVALSTFASGHDGNYPGVALPTADNVDGVDPFYTNEGLFTMRGIIGGGQVKPEDANLDFLDGFYFTPIPPNPPYNIPDRLVGDNEIDGVYPKNPFRTNVRGVTDQAIPMMNVFGIEFTFQPVPAPDIFNEDPAPVRLCEPLWSGQDGDITTLTPGGIYNFPAPGGADVRFIGDINDPLRYDPDEDWKIGKGDLQATGFPEGQFAYIPLDPVQPDPNQPDFMRYCKNYWLVIYGSTSSAQRNKYEKVVPNFPAPLGDNNPNNYTAYEYTVKQALVGALDVITTAYEAQVRVEGS